MTIGGDQLQLTQGRGVMYVSITLPASGSNAASLDALIRAGVDSATGAAPSPDKCDQIISATIRGHTGYSVGGSATSTPLAVPSGNEITEPGTGYHKDSFVRNSASATMTVWVACVLSVPVN